MFRGVRRRLKHLARCGYGVSWEAKTKRNIIDKRQVEDEGEGGRNGPGCDGWGFWLDLSLG